jgi:flavin-binding protein dodecin
MAVASVSTIPSASPNSWQEAAELGFARASKTLRGITGMKIVEEKARIEDGAIVEFLVTLEVIFVLEDVADESVDAASDRDEEES